MRDCGQATREKAARVHAQQALHEMALFPPPPPPPSPTTDQLALYSAFECGGPPVLVPFNSSMCFPAPDQLAAGGYASVMVSIDDESDTYALALWDTPTCGASAGGSDPVTVATGYVEECDDSRLPAPFRVFQQQQAQERPPSAAHTRTKPTTGPSARTTTAASAGAAAGRIHVVDAPMSPTLDSRRQSRRPSSRRIESFAPARASPLAHPRTVHLISPL